MASSSTQHVLTPHELQEIERNTASSVDALQAIIADRSITAANRALAREALAAAEANLIKVRRLLGRPVAVRPSETDLESLAEQEHDARVARAERQQG